MAESVEQALRARTDLDVYRSAKRSLYALQLAMGIEDIHTTAATSLTDGPDDKSCDLVHVDRDAGQIIIGQGYEAQSRKKSEAPQSKAASLHQAVSWVLAQELSKLPSGLAAAAREVHDALEDNVIQQIQVWFVHNLPESQNVKSELDAICGTVSRLVRQRYPETALDSVAALEIGQSTLESWYLGSQTPILVTDQFTLATSGAFEEKGENWNAVCTSVPASWLHSLVADYGDKVFSANVRGYLGSNRSKGNINNGIKDTAQHKPRHFWAYNNGITALVHGYQIHDGNSVTINGIAIVNGAQTTGALGNVSSNSIDEVKVLARFIHCNDADTVRDIIRYNNRQNPTEASDFRSNDRIQTRLVQEFKDLGVVGYSGGRRGGAEDVIRRPADNQISAAVAAQALAAFHREPGLAYHEKGQIWESNQIYDRFFSDRTSARHILYCYTLLRAVDEEKQQLLGKPDNQRTEPERDLGDFFRQRGANLLVVAALGDCSEIYLGRQVQDRFSLRFKDAPSLSEAVARWKILLTPALALAAQTLGSTLRQEGNLRRAEAVGEAIRNFRSLFAATKAANQIFYDDFARNVVSS